MAISKEELSGIDLSAGVDVTAEDLQGIDLGAGVDVGGAPSMAQERKSIPINQFMRMDPLTALGYQYSEDISPKFSKDKSALSAILDLENLTGRTLAATISALRGEGFDLGKTESTPFGEEGRWQDVLRTSGLTASALTAGAASPYVAGARAASPMLGAAVEFGVPALTGAAFTQAQNVREGGEFSPGWLAAETMMGAGIGKGAQIAGAKLLPKFQEMAESFASKYGGVSEDILKLYGGKGVLQSLKKTISSKWADAPASAESPAAKLKAVQEMAGSIQPLAEDFVRLVDDIPKSVADDIAARDEVLASAPSINLAPVIKQIQSLKKTSPSGKLGEKANLYNEEIDNILSVLTGKDVGSTLMPKTKYSPVDVITLRDMVSPKTNFQAFPGAKSDIDGLYNNVYRMMRESLVESAEKSGGGEIYKKAMKDASDKLKLRDELYSVIGKNNLNAEERAGRFLKGLTTGDKFAKRKFLENIDKTFGKDFTQKVDLYRLSQDLDPLGRLPWFTKVATGAGNTPALLNKALQLGAMPKVAAPILSATRKATGLAGDILNRGAIPLSRIGAGNLDIYGDLVSEQLTGGR